MSDLTPEQLETIGKRVHYQTTEGPRAAVITEVFHPVNNETRASLMVMRPSGIAFVAKAKYAFPPEVGCWNWPSVVDDEGEPCQPPPPAM